ncbi:MAG TPA: alkaline phosphatase family protein, partial [Anaerolineae bacterium]|nr:alkaline phosphatase family protein [Anaerolineae bacterium]
MKMTTASQSTSGAATSAGKVLVIGLDGATFDLIKPWAAEGRLPTLARLLAVTLGTPQQTGGRWN